MPSDVFWTGLFTVGGGSVAGAVGYGTARLQSARQREQIQLDERRHESEETRGSQELADQRREQRRQIYLKYLEALDAIINLATATDVELALLHTRWGEFMRADNELELAGTDEIKEASYALNALAAEINSEYAAILLDPDRDWKQAGTDEYKHDELRQLRGTIVSFMRDDLHSDLS